MNNVYVEGFLSPPKYPRIGRFRKLITMLFFPWLYLLKFRRRIIALTEENARLTEDNARLTEDNDRLTEENDSLTRKYHFYKEQKDKLTTKIFDVKRSLSLSMIDEESISRMLSLPEYIEVDPGTISGMLNWPEYAKHQLNYNYFLEIIRIMKLHLECDSNELDMSLAWKLLSTKNLNQLFDDGYNNFKRTINHNYFEFFVEENDPQIENIEVYLPQYICDEGRKTYQINNNMTDDEKKRLTYQYFVFLLLMYAQSVDEKKYLDSIDEPLEGNPIVVKSNDKNYSQDLCNSIIEYYVLSSNLPINSLNTVLEIGAGYGRNAYVFLKLNQHIKYIIVDIMPALYISQRYLSSQFSNKEIFTVQHFDKYDDIQEKFEHSDIIFLLPHQVNLLPKNLIDLIINISSFGEMTEKQIKEYFYQIERLKTNYFYTKQWIESKNPFDKLNIRAEDYPVNQNWEKLFLGRCVVQNNFFEAVYKLNKS